MDLTIWTEADTDSTIPRRFAEVARQEPGRTAISTPTRSLTYAELDDLSNRFVAGLLERHAARGGRVALVLGHDETVIAAMLAVLRCGMAGVVLNAGDPPARLAQIAGEIQPAAVITDRGHRSAAAGAHVGQADMVVEAAERGRVPTAELAPSADDLAILISTSGSTGRPKIVMQTHRNQLHNVLRYTNGLGVQPDDRVAWLASLSGGQGLATVWSALLNGATLCPFPIAERGVTGLADWLEEERVTVFDTIPSVLRSFARTLHERRIHGVRMVRLASEAAQRSDFDSYRQHFSGGCVLASVLASSEAGIISEALLNHGDEPADGRLSVGVPVEGVRVVLVDETGRDATGDLGEIAIEGRYLSPGYWRDDALTAQRFEAVEGRRRFRTGDVARRAPDGSLTIVGRTDSQVKVRGYRLQLEEVEAAILGLRAGVAEAAVVARVSGRGDARLTAYVTAARGASLDLPRLRTALRGVLPSHAVPSEFVPVDAMPITPHGKVDRERLGELGRAHFQSGSGAETGSEMEQVLAGLWAEALERDAVGLEDSFLGLGGDSLTAAMIAANVDDLFGVDLELSVFAADLTVTKLAALIDEHTHEERDDRVPLVRLRSRSGPLSFTQARFWMEQQQSDSEARWNVAVPFRITGDLDVDVFRRSVEQLVRRHEILRTAYVVVDGEPVANVQAQARFELVIEDLRTVPDQQEHIHGVMAAELSRPYEVASEPLLRLRLMRLREDEHLLLRLSHHLIHDAISWKVFFDELALVYTALKEGRRSPLSDEAELQYIDFAVWERASLRPNSERFRAEVDWWANACRGAPAPIRLPFMRDRSQATADRGDVIRWGLPASVSRALDRIGRGAGATYYMSRLAIFAALLAIEGEADHLVIGTPISTRIRAEVQRMFGPFINFRQLPLGFRGDPTFTGLLREVRRTVLDVGARSTIPWEVLVHQVRARGIRIPRGSATFVEWSSVLPMSFAGIHVDPLPRPCSVVHGFRLGVNRHYETDRCWAEYDPRVHDRPRIVSFLDRYTALAERLAQSPERPIRELYSAIPASDGFAADAGD